MKQTMQTDGLVDWYLAELSRALGGLPADRRRQIVDEVAGHIADGRADLDHEDPASIGALLARVGDPWVIAAAADADAGADAHDPARHRPQWIDRLVPWTLLFGGFMFAVGWFVGVILLWASPTWRVRDKVLGTLVLPGGLAGGWLLALLPKGSQSCSGYRSPGHPLVLHCTTSGFVPPVPLAIALLVVAVVAPILTAVHLERARRVAADAS